MIYQLLAVVVFAIPFAVLLALTCRRAKGRSDMEYREDGE